MTWTYALRRGMECEGVKTFVRSAKRASKAEIAVIWGAQEKAVLNAAQHTGQRVLVMERGFLQPRREWVSLAFDGLNGRGNFPPCVDNGERWHRHFSGYLKPWRDSPGDYVLLIGQVPNDASLRGLDILRWAQTQTDALRDRGHNVRYRAHPNNPTPCPRGATLSTSNLTEDLRQADRVVAFNSTTAVEAVLAGIPTVVHDRGSVAWEMASHGIDTPLVRPDRTAWAYALAWRQWRMEELADGTAWRVMRNLL